MGLVSAQARLQARLKPASWVPGVRWFHSESAEWRVQGTPVEALMDKVWSAAAELSSRGWSQHEQDKVGKRIVLNALTQGLKWLDQVELRFAEVEGGWTQVRVRGYSTGLLPMVVPLAPLLNVLLCLFPFLCFGKVGAELSELRDAVARKGDAVESRGVSYSLGSMRGAVVAPQAAVQAVLKPAMWLPGVRRMHWEIHEWELEESVEAAMSLVWDCAFDGSRGWSQYKLDRAGRRMVLHFLTPKAKWLDALELSFSAAGTGGGTRVRVSAFSTGMLPLSIPLAPLLNVALLWFPFGDKDGKCGTEIDELKELVVRKSKRVSSQVLMYSLANPARARGVTALAAPVAHA
jgi:hypothetical protein